MSQGKKGDDLKIQAQQDRIQEIQIKHIVCRSLAELQAYLSNEAGLIGSLYSERFEPVSKGDIRLKLVCADVYRAFADAIVASEIGWPQPTGWRIGSCIDGD